MKKVYVISEQDKNLDYLKENLKKFKDTLNIVTIKAVNWRGLSNNEFIPLQRVSTKAEVVGVGIKGDVSFSTTYKNSQEMVDACDLLF